MSYTYKNFVIRVTATDGSKSIAICDHPDDIELDTDYLIFWDGKIDDNSIAESLNELKRELILWKQSE